MKDSFGYWLAGFADGEGCFLITAARWPHCRFQIALRADDKPVLEHCQQESGLGSLRFLDIPKYSKLVGASPQWLWSVQRKLECQRLVEIFDTYPLVSKKAADYAIWREAVALHALVVPSGSNASVVAAISQHRKELQDQRKFRLTNISE